MNKILVNIKNRRSIRRYVEDQIKDEELDMIIEAAIYALPEIMIKHGTLQFTK